MDYTEKVTLITGASSGIGAATALAGYNNRLVLTARREERLQTIHPGFVDTEAVREDGIPAPNEISEEKAAQYVLAGLKKEMRENIFPPGTKWATKLGKVVPHWLLTRILLSQTPAEY